MKRKNFPQLMDQTWFPGHIKTLADEFLSWFVIKVNATLPFIPVFNAILDKTGSKRIIYIDLNNGAGMESTRAFLPKEVQIETTNLRSINFDQKNVVFALINSLHKLNPDQVKDLFEKVAKSGNSIVAVEGNNDNWWQAIGMTIFVPLTVLMTGFFVKPFRWTRILFTYLIPILLVVIPIDGILALFKLYSPKDLEKITSGLENKAYKWESGKLDNGRGGKIIFLKGTP